MLQHRAPLLQHASWLCFMAHSQDAHSCSAAPPCCCQPVETSRRIDKKLAARASPYCGCTTSCGSSCRHQVAPGCRQLCRHLVVPTTSRSLISVTVTSSQTGNKHTQRVLSQPATTAWWTPPQGRPRSRRPWVTTNKVSGHVNI